MTAQETVVPVMESQLDAVEDVSAIIEETIESKPVVEEQEKTLFVAKEEEVVEKTENSSNVDAPNLPVADKDIDEIMKYISHDKKSKGGKPRFVLVAKPEKPVVDVEVMPSDIKDSILILKNKFSK